MGWKPVVKATFIKRPKRVQISAASHSVNLDLFEGRALSISRQLSETTLQLSSGV